MKIPAFVNLESGSAKRALKSLEPREEFEIRTAAPAELPAMVTEAVAAGVPRILVAGGDGTISTAAGVLACTPVELALLPGGTLNHFARDHGIPTDPDEALTVALDGVVRTTDVGYCNDTLFINTSSVGAYVHFVRSRDRIERLFGYGIASLLAGVRVLLTPRVIPVRLEVAGETRLYTTPLAFVGVGERNLGIPGFGQRIEDGARGLHVVLLRGRRQARRFVRAYGRQTRGLPVEEKKFGVDAALVESFRLDLPARATHVAEDGEIRTARTPFAYRIARDALRIVVPRSG